MDKSDTVLMMTDRYWERYGKALIGVLAQWIFPQ